MENIPIYFETGKKRVFACAVAWPGWSRSAASEDAAIQTLLDYAPRYARIFENEPAGFAIPKSSAEFKVVERVEGGSTTDFGVPWIEPAVDAPPLQGEDLSRLNLVLAACWHALEHAASQAEGKELRTGPRGGGRDREKILRHVFDANTSYLAKLAYKPPRPIDTCDDAIQANFSALQVAAGGNLPKQGPRGGKLWSPRYFVRRAAWHILDHAWEIEDRILDRPGSN